MFWCFFLLERWAIVSLGVLLSNRCFKVWWGQRMRSCDSLLSGLWDWQTNWMLQDNWMPETWSISLLFSPLRIFNCCLQRQETINVWGQIIEIELMLSFLWNSALDGILLWSFSLWFWRYNFQFVIKLVEVNCFENSFIFYLGCPIFVEDSILLEIIAKWGRS